METEVVLFEPMFALALALAPASVGTGLGIVAPADAGPPPSAPPPAVTAPPPGPTPPSAAPPPGPAAPPAAATAPAPAPAEPPGGRPPAPPSPIDPMPAAVEEPPPARAFEGDLAVEAEETETEVITKRITVVHHRSVPPPPPPPPRSTAPNKRFFLGGYGGMTTRVTNISKKVGIMMGFRAGVLLGKRLSLGGAYHQLRRRYGPPILDDQDNPMALKMGYGGATIGATIIRHDNLELNAQTLLGAGMSCVSYNTKPQRGLGSQNCVESVRMLVAEPEAAFNVTVTDWMRFGLTLGYRIVAREKWSPPNNFKLSGAHMGLNFEFGWFGRS